MKGRVLVVGGAIAALMAAGTAANAAGPNNGACSPAAYSPSGTTGTNPATGGVYYINAPSGAPGTSGSIGGGTSGSSGYIQGNATGTAGPPPDGSLTVSGSQPNTGLNGNVVASADPSVCVGSTVAGGGVSAP